MSLYRLSPYRESKIAIGMQFEIGIPIIKQVRYSQYLWKHKNNTMDIELLLITFFYTYMRPLVEAGKLYRAVTPLYIIRQHGKEYYAYSDEELENWKKEHTGSFDLLRAKGLGELNAEDLKKVCFENERFKRITISDIEESTKLLNILQGPQVDLRKKYIYDNALELGFHFD